MNHIHDIPDESGSVTLETTLMFSGIFTLVIVLCWICLLLYEQANLNVIAQKASQRGAEIWASSGKEIFTSKQTENNPQMLYQLFYDADKDKKIKQITKYVALSSSPYGYFESKNKKIEISIKRCVLYRKVEVKITKKLMVPLISLLERIGFGETFILSARASSIVEEDASTIDSIDFFHEIIDESGIYVDFKRKMDDIFKKIENFFG